MAKVLGISPGTRLVGIAVLDEQGLADWNIYSFRESWSSKKLKKIIAEISMLIEEQGIQKIAVKVPDVIPAEPGYGKVLGALNVFFERNSIKARYYTLSELLKLYSPDETISRKVLVQIIAAYYPELARYMQDGKRYYDKLFESVAVGHLLATKHKFR